ncbi:MAG: hypothetical protein ACJ8EB_03445 [Allosphingosinicella sp.]
MAKYGSSRPSGGGGLAALLVPLLLVSLVGGGGYFAWQYTKTGEAKETDAHTGCLTNVPTPQAVLFLIDATDRLSKENAERIGSRIKDAVDGLDRYSRVLIVSFGGDTATPLHQIYNGCIPGKASTARWDEGAQLLGRQYDEFKKQLDGLVTQLQQLPDAKTSPITEQVVRAASDPQLHWEANVRTLVLVTDGLQSTIYWTRHLKLPDPPAGLLKDVRAEYFEVGNEKGTRLQTPEMRLEWKSWFERAGADIRITAPGFPASPQ